MAGFWTNSFGYPDKRYQRRYSFFSQFLCVLLIISLFLHRSVSLSLLLLSYVYVRLSLFFALLLSHILLLFPFLSSFLSNNFLLYYIFMCYPIVGLEVTLVLESLGRRFHFRSGWTKNLGQLAIFKKPIYLLEKFVIWVTRMKVHN